jgi:hypothetical protein
MPTLRDAIRTAIADEHREVVKAAVRESRFAYAEGVETLYKFKSLAGDSREHVKDIIQNSRLYFSTQAQFNDPLDCAPIFKLAGDPNDPAFMAELRKDEEDMIREEGLTPERVAELRATEGTAPAELAAAITRNVRENMRRTLHVYCFSATREPTLLWSHYAGGHAGVCLHFKAVHGELTGLARGIDYVADRPPIMVPLRYNLSEQEVSRRMGLTKAESWRYESEYRILANSDVDWGYPFDGRHVSFPRQLLTGVTVGVRISPADREAVLQWTRDRNPPLTVWEAYEDPHHFTLQYRQLAAMPP